MLKRNATETQNAAIDAALARLLPAPERPECEHGGTL